MTDSIRKTDLGSARRRGFLIAGLTVSIAWLVSPVGHLHAQDKAQQLRAIRDAAITDLGWVTGNAKGTPAWEKIAPYAAPGGKYYEFWMRLKPAGADPKTEAEHNTQVFQDGYKQGRSQKYNEAEDVRRAKDVGLRIKQLDVLHLWNEPKPSAPAK